ncbi:alpha/beta fold hydrolase [Pseudonocardia sp. 73-21]|uniref:alpha/beta fold hydrolase n=2 Tax=unclassified Pseudonocardia TaxID=2619320 RepID=UPI002615D6E3|nr:alpha/beta fold hydrolase [Pseudonocardia sp. 73-21]
MVRITVDGAELALDGYGEGDPLVLVHGTGAQASSWGRSTADLAAGGRRVLAYDRRGYGRSVHRPVRDYRVHIDDLAAVLEHLGRPADVLGWSSGGNLTLALAARRPELFRSVVVLEAPWHGLRGATPDLLAALAKAKRAPAGRGHDRRLVDRGQGAGPAGASPSRAGRSVAWLAEVPTAVEIVGGAISIAGVVALRSAGRAAASPRRRRRWRAGRPAARWPGTPQPSRSRS